MAWFADNKFRVVLLIIAACLGILGAALARQSSDKHNERFEETLGAFVPVFLVFVFLRGMEVLAFALFAVLCPMFLAWANVSDTGYSDISHTDRSRAGYGIMAAAAILGFILLTRLTRMKRPPMDHRHTIIFVTLLANVVGVGLLWKSYVAVEHEGGENVILMRRFVLSIVSMAIVVFVCYARIQSANPSSEVHDWKYVALFWFAAFQAELLDFQGLGTWPDYTIPTRTRVGTTLCWISHIVWMVMIYWMIVDQHYNRAQTLRIEESSNVRTFVLTLCLVLCVAGAAMADSADLWTRILICAAVVLIFVAHFLNTPYAVPLLIVAMALSLDGTREFFGHVAGGADDAHTDVQKAGHAFMITAPWLSFIMASDKIQSLSAALTDVKNAMFANLRAFISTGLMVLNVVGIIMLASFAHGKQFTTIEFYSWTIADAFLAYAFFWVAAHFLPQTYAGFVRVCVIMYLAFMQYAIGETVLFEPEDYDVDPKTNTSKAGVWILWVNLWFMIIFTVCDLYLFTPADDRETDAGTDTTAQTPVEGAYARFNAASMA